MLLLFAACGGPGSGGDSSNSQLPLLPPAQFTASSYDAQTIKLTWIYPSMEFDGYTLEGRIGAGDFQPINTELIPYYVGSITLTLDTTFPDLVTYSFRIRTVKGGVNSGYSNVAAYERPLLPPSGLTATYSESLAGISLKWERNSLTADGVQLERIVQNESGVTVGDWTVVTLTDPLATTYLDTNVQDGYKYNYRVKNMKGALGSQAAVLTLPVVFSSVAPPSFIKLNLNPEETAFDVTWGIASSATDTTLLERKESNAVGTVIAGWTELARVIPAVTTFHDSTVLDGRNYAYRVTSLRNGLSSPPTATYSWLIPVIAPANLIVVPTINGFHLSWENQSKTASEVRVYRCHGSNGYFLEPVAVLSSSVATYDEVIPSLGYYSYAIKAAGADITSSWSPYVTVVTPAAQNALSLSSRSLDYPISVKAAVLRPQGTWVLGATEWPFGVLANGDLWKDNYPSDGDYWAAPYLRVDPQGWPHFIYQRTSSTQDTTNTHTWFDGKQWQRDSFNSLPFTNSSAPGYTFCLDGDGEPHMLLEHSTASYPFGGSSENLDYAHKANGTWTKESLATLKPQISYARNIRLTVDDTKRAHLLISNGDSLVEYSRSGSSSWVSSTLPTGAVKAGGSDYVDGKWFDDANGWVFYTRQAGGGLAFMAMQKLAGAWQDPVMLDFYQFSFQSIMASFEISSDHQRLVVLVSAPLGLKTYEFAGNTWHQTLLGPYGATLSVPGLDSHNRLRILVKDGNSHFSEFYEP